MPSSDRGVTTMAEKLCLVGTAGLVTKLMGGGVVVLSLSFLFSCPESPSVKTLISSSENHCKDYFIESNLGSLCCQIQCTGSNNTSNCDELNTNFFSYLVPH